MKSDLVDLTMQMHAMTERAIRVSLDGDDGKAVWLPLSQVEVLRRPRGMVEITCPEHMALEKGLI
ncbi:MAG: hypothetical protein ACXIVF_15620 [Rhizobiaceae bacterium]